MEHVVKPEMELLAGAGRMTFRGGRINFFVDGLFGFKNEDGNVKTSIFTELTAGGIIQKMTVD